MFYVGMTEDLELVLSNRVPEYCNYNVDNVVYDEDEQEYIVYLTDEYNKQTLLKVSCNKHTRKSHKYTINIASEDVHECMEFISSDESVHDFNRLFDVA